MLAPNICEPYNSNWRIDSLGQCNERIKLGYNNSNDIGNISIWIIFQLGASAIWKICMNFGSQKWSGLLFYRIHLFCWIDLNIKT